jgi:hypothetical protein
MAESADSPDHHAVRIGHSGGSSDYCPRTSLYHRSDAEEGRPPGYACPYAACSLWEGNHSRDVSTGKTRCDQEDAGTIAQEAGSPAVCHRDLTWNTHPGRISMKGKGAGWRWPFTQTGIVEIGARRTAGGRFARG